jgi:hypothetical protein
VSRTPRRSLLGTVVWTAVLLLMLAAGTMTLGAPAWADEPGQGDDVQAQQPTQPTPTQPPPTPTQPPPTPTQPPPTPTQPPPTPTQPPPTPTQPTTVRPILMTVTPRAGGVGTTVKLTAEVGHCQRVYVYFYDSKSDGVTIAGGAKPIKPLRVTTAGRLTASYTVTRKDATGPARFTAVCGLEDGTARAGEASFQVRAPSGGGTGAGGGGTGASGRDNNANRNNGTQIPTQIDTGLGGTADRGIDPLWLLFPAGLLLIALGAGLWLRQATIRRQR